MGRSEPMLQYLSRRVIGWGGSYHWQPLTTAERALLGMNGEPRWRGSTVFMPSFAGQSLTDEAEI